MPSYSLMPGTFHWWTWRLAYGMVGIEAALLSVACFHGFIVQLTQGAWANAAVLFTLGVVLIPFAKVLICGDAIRFVDKVFTWALGKIGVPNA